MHVRGCNGWQRRSGSARRYEWTWHSPSRCWLVTAAHVAECTAIVPLFAGVDERARDRDGRTAYTFDLRSVNGASLQHPASIDYLRYGALQTCIGLQSLRFSALRCRLAGRLDWNNLRCIKGGKICNLQPTITVHCQIAGVRCQALEIKFHNKCFASDSTIARSRSTMTGTKASASSADE
jgi:hypothetical protein